MLLPPQDKEMNLLKSNLSMKFLLKVWENVKWEGLGFLKKETIDWKGCCSEGSILCFVEKVDSLANPKRLDGTLPFGNYLIKA